MKKKRLIIAFSVFMAIVAAAGVHFSYFFKGLWRDLSALTRHPHT